MCQKRKLPIYVYIFLKLRQLKLLGCLLCFPRNNENSQCRNLEIQSRNQVGSKNKPSISSSSCHSNDIWVMKESCICSLMLSVFIIFIILYRVLCDDHLPTEKFFMQMWYSNCCCGCLLLNTNCFSYCRHSVVLDVAGWVVQTFTELISDISRNHLLSNLRRFSQDYGHFVFNLTIIFCKV